MSDTLVEYRAAQRLGRQGMVNRYRRMYGGRPSRVLGLRGSPRLRMRFGGSRTATRTRNRSTHGIGVTEQHDSRLVYKKSRMPSRRRRGWKKFKNKVLAVSEKDLGSQTIIFNTQPTATNTTSGNQVVWSCALYPSASSTTYWNDLDSIGAANALASTTSGSDIAVYPSTKIIFKSAVLDLTIRNISTNNGAPDSALRMEVDVYELYATRVGDEEGTTYNTILDLFAQNPARTKPIGADDGAGPTEVNLNLRGVTPFDCTYTLSNFKVKITRKTKYQISNGDQVTYQLRDPRRYVRTQRALTSTEGFVEPGMTKMVIVIGRVPPGTTVGAVGTPGVCQEQLAFGLTRKYFYKVENWSDDRTAYVNG